MNFTGNVGAHDCLKHLTNIMHAAVKTRQTQDVPFVRRSEHHHLQLSPYKFCLGSFIARVHNPSQLAQFASVCKYAASAQRVRCSKHSCLGVHALHIS